MANRKRSSEILLPTMEDIVKYDKKRGTMRISHDGTFGPLTGASMAFGRGNDYHLPGCNGLA
jgi:hypothetical protein